MLSYSPGLWLRGLSRRFSHVIALDQSQNLLEKADHGKEANEGGDQSRLAVNMWLVS